MNDSNTTERTPRTDNRFTAAHVARMQETIDRLTRERDEARKERNHAEENARLSKIHEKSADAGSQHYHKMAQQAEAERAALQSDLSKAHELLAEYPLLKAQSAALAKAREEIARLREEREAARDKTAYDRNLNRLRAELVGCEGFIEGVKQGIESLRAELAAANARADHFRARVEAAHIAAGYDPKQDCDIAEVIACLLTRAREGETRAEKAERDRDEALALVEKVREVMDNQRIRWLARDCRCDPNRRGTACHRCLSIAETNVVLALAASDALRALKLELVEWAGEDGARPAEGRGGRESGK